MVQWFGLRVYKSQRAQRKEKLDICISFYIIKQWLKELEKRSLKKINS